MNLLTFDIEDWYNCDFISNDFNWDKHEVRIYQGVEKILTALADRNLKASFFCLGWLAEKHPDAVRSIHKEGHHIGCHSYQHELSFRFNKKEFEHDTLRAKHLIEDVIGEEVNAFRAPGFSITKNNVWALETLSEIGFQYDCSLFPAAHDYGGITNYGRSIPKIITMGSGKQLKEFPINIYLLWGKSIVFSGGGFFRLFPYWFIRHLTKRSTYIMTYFHPRDFDTGQPIIKSLPPIRKFKSYVGIKGAFDKFTRLLDEFDFLNIPEANDCIDWNAIETIHINELKK